MGPSLNHVWLSQEVSILFCFISGSQRFGLSCFQKD